MLSFLMAFLPTLVKPVLDYLTRLKDAKVEMYIAKTGADRDTAISAIQAVTAIQSRWWFVAALVPLFAFPFVVYTWQVVIYDKLIAVWLTGHTHDTDPINGTVGWVYTVVVSSIFVHGIVDSVVRKK